MNGNSPSVFRSFPPEADFMGLYEPSPPYRHSLISHRGPFYQRRIPIGLSGPIHSIFHNPLASHHSPPFHETSRRLRSSYRNFPLLLPYSKKRERPEPLPSLRVLVLPSAPSSYFFLAARYCVTASNATGNIETMMMPSTTVSKCFCTQVMRPKTSPEVIIRNTQRKLPTTV